MGKTPERQRFGAYWLLKRLAKGGMAEIYLACPAAPGREDERLAIKRLLPQFSADQEFLELFLKEAKLASQLAHPNIVRILELGQEDGHLYMAMEYLDGRDLELLIRSRRRWLSPALGAYVGSAVCSALGYAHQATDLQGQPLGIVHRDVTPENVMVTHEGVVKLVDFGVARASARLSTTRPGVVRGKVSHMAPEHIAGKELDGRADLFALGATLFELTTGIKPFERGQHAASMWAVLHENPPSPKEIQPNFPAQLSDIIMKALEKNPDRRWRTAGAMREALDAFLDSTGEDAGPEQLALLVVREPVEFKETRDEEEAPPAPAPSPPPFDESPDGDDEPTGSHQDLSARPPPLDESPDGDDEPTGSNPGKPAGDALLRAETLAKASAPPPRRLAPPVDDAAADDEEPERSGTDAERDVFTRVTGVPLEADLEPDGQVRVATMSLDTGAATAPRVKRNTGEGDWPAGDAGLGDEETPPHGTPAPPETPAPLLERSLAASFVKGLVVAVLIVGSAFLARHATLYEVRSKLASGAGDAVPVAALPADPADAGEPGAPDAEVAGEDAAVDGGEADAGAPDAAGLDAGVPDGGPADAGIVIKKGFGLLKLQGRGTAIIDGGKTCRMPCTARLPSGEHVVRLGGRKPVEKRILLQANQKLLLKLP